MNQILLVKPYIGEIRTSVQIGIGIKAKSNKYIWQECTICKKARWVAICHGVPKFPTCVRCANEHKSTKAYKVYPLPKGTSNEPIIGDIVHGKILNKDKQAYYVWQACADCGKTRWVKIRSDKPKATKCLACVNKLRHVNEYVHNYKWIRIDKSDPLYIMCVGNKGGKTGLLFEHRYVMAKILGRPLEKWEQPHHRDGNKLNNDPSNLELRIGNHGSGASLKPYEEELLRRLAELYKENEALKKSIQPDQTAGNIIGEVVTNG